MNANPTDKPTSAVNPTATHIQITQPDGIVWSRKAFNDVEWCEVVEQIKVTHEAHGVGGGAAAEFPPGWYAELEASTCDGGAVLDYQMMGPYPSSMMALLGAYQIIVEASGDE